MHTVELIKSAEAAGFITPADSQRYTKTLPKLKGRLFLDYQGGRVACYRHLGSYGQAAVLDRPLARQWATPLDLWTPVLPGARGYSCEDCS